MRFFQPPYCCFLWNNVLKEQVLILRFIRIIFTHVRLVCDIYCAHAYLCRCDSTLFCFRKLKLRQLIFLINCRSNLTINIVKRGKKMKNEWLTMPTGKLYFSFQAFTWLVLCCWRSWSWRTWLKPRELERKYLKIWSWETYRFLWNMSR